METLKEYNAVLERARKKLKTALENLPGDQLMDIAKLAEVSYSTVLSYKYGTGENLKTILTIQGAVLKYKAEKK